MSKHGCDECGKWHDGRVGCEMTDQPLSSTLEDSRFNRFDDELIDTYFNEAGKQAIRDYIANQVEANTPTSTDDELDKETAARIREINLLLIDGKCTPEYAYERIEEIVKEQLNANQPQTDEVKPTPVGEFNYRPGVSVRSANQPQTELEAQSSVIIAAMIAQKHFTIAEAQAYLNSYVLAHQEQAVQNFKDIIKSADTYTFETGEIYYSEKAVLKAKQGAFNKFATNFNNYASEHRDVVSTEAVGIVWGILAQQQIPIENRIAELTSKESE